MKNLAEKARGKYDEAEELFTKALGVDEVQYAVQFTRLAEVFFKLCNVSMRYSSRIPCPLSVLACFLLLLASFSCFLPCVLAPSFFWVGECANTKKVHYPILYDYPRVFQVYPLFLSLRTHRSI